jgi:hypothetical protein
VLDPHGGAGAEDHRSGGGEEEEEAVALRFVRNSGRWEWD